MGTKNINGVLIKAAPKWTGQIGAGGVVSASTQTIPLQSATGLDDEYVYVFSIDRVDSNNKKTPAKWEVAIGKLSGTNFISCIRGVEGTAQSHAAGAVVEILFTATNWNKLLLALETLGVNPDTGKFRHLLMTKQSTTPPTPGAGDINVFVDTDGNVKKIDQTGAVTFFTPEKATGSEVDAGTNDTKYLTPKSIADSSIGRFKATGSEVDAGTNDTKYLTPKSIADSSIGRFKATGSDVDAGTDDSKYVTSKAIADSHLGYVNLTNASSDYNLRRGETAFRTFSSTTSVPLYIATASGRMYELRIMLSNNAGSSGGSGAPTYVRPNNTAYTNEFRYSEICRNNGGLFHNVETHSSFRIGWALSNLFANIYNFTTNKTIIGNYIIYGMSNDIATTMVFSTSWQNTTTEWTSLGTIVPPQNISGVIVVKRLY